MHRLGAKLALAVVLLGATLVSAQPFRSGPGLTVVAGGGGGGPIATQSCTTANSLARLSTASTSAAVLDCANITSDGTDSTITGGALKFAGAANAPRLKNTAGNYGWYWAPAFTLTDGATKLFSVDVANGHAVLQNGAQYQVSATQDSTASVDLGWKRLQAGVWASTNGSSGTGRFGAAVQAETCADDTVGAQAASLTITPASNVITITNADADGCNITVSETGAAVGTVITFVVISNTGGTVNFSDSAGVTELAGAFNATLEDVLTLVYVGTAYREVARSAN